ncbi:MAG: hypothetical protein A3I77_08080 [Gammaproteobacteria bacterium RIFCSPLOWO2_02_FULL_42_14]|nr:MAG: hypothetical protein A3B71_03915 [Gammaproteobacteria bacterium RIFCSPHIGHO2_02_FULL_42_43]OGT52933.1 MAG: hypothetical protein A3E54_07610 [Gammaproteobacteria bacterium RIFCSPHIGHO2_12_FULL_41_25]OGT61293.1 MAG: hypothetical protein A3I77_08080 [Gammaproteobacteria bacterium RIFCSPLOWO2_02_FULL_42_14]OGT87222.1 MAG: hypothetical protein A3G86_01805 [Gammaproteobacteria bacterium RIFCSPLOWO2_12_FULL_42_18]
MKKLRQLQKQFQQYLFCNQTKILMHCDKPDRLTIYQNSYHERMIASLAQDFPALQTAIGEAAFASLVIDYVTEHPSTHYNLREAGKHLAKFILSRDPNFLPYAEMARHK